uniref:Transmembrane protein n=1 Tax=Medicago truncatula TaxID=3880 RepID=I3T102_MEDTR|nr:unknown [Medicago truncatula]
MASYDKILGHNPHSTHLSLFGILLNLSNQFLFLRLQSLSFPFNFSNRLIKHPFIFPQKLCGSLSTAEQKTHIECFAPMLYYAIPILFGITLCYFPSKK